MISYIIPTILFAGLLFRYIKYISVKESITIDINNIMADCAISLAGIIMLTMIYIITKYEVIVFMCIIFAIDIISCLFVVKGKINSKGLYIYRGMGSKIIEWTEDDEVVINILDKKIKIFVFNIRNNDYTFRKGKVVLPSSERNIHAIREIMKRDTSARFSIEDSRVSSSG